MNRRQFLLNSAGLSCGLGLSALAYGALPFWSPPRLFNPCITPQLSDTLAQHPLMQRIWQGIDPQQVWDCHVHLVGVGDSNAEVWFNPKMDAWLHPLLKLQKSFYINGTCSTAKNVDKTVIERLVDLHRAMPVGYKSMLMAFDWAHDAQGQPDREHSIFHISNQYAAEIAKQYPQYFEWTASIHPYRPDAVDALDEAAALGARAIKWLPSGMNINPASSQCDAFYRKAAALNLPIISHTGAESAVPGGNMAWGNPLRMRRALDFGVRVVLAHCASDGEDQDTDNGNKRVKSFDLFTRLMNTADYQTHLFGEISAITLINHVSAIRPLLEHTDWHPRLLNGSDYPLPAIMPLVSPGQLAKLGLLDAESTHFLQALKPYNALLFDFALKRLLTANGQRFADTIFMTQLFFNPATRT